MLSPRPVRVLTLCCLLSAVVTVADAQVEWKERGKYFYAIFKQEAPYLNYAQAEILCKQHGAILPEPRTDAENKHLNELGSEKFYLGMRRAGDTPFTWNSDGSRASQGFKDPWIASDIGDVGLCAMMMRNYKCHINHDPIGWHSYPCNRVIIGHKDCLGISDATDVVCQGALPGTLPVAWIKDETSTHAQGKSTPGKSYHVIKEDLTFYAAQNTCRSVGGQLAFPTTADENTFIGELDKTREMWIGLTDEDTEGRFQHVSGVGVTAEFFDQSVRTENSKARNYVTVRWSDAEMTGVWGVAACTDRHWGVCQKDDPSMPNCPTGFDLRGHWCYKYNKQDKKTYANAAAACNKTGAFLAEPKTDAENYVIEVLTKDLKSENNEAVWLGATANPDKLIQKDGVAHGVGEFVWTTRGGKLNLTDPHWARSSFGQQPDNDQHNQFCLQYRKSSYSGDGWDDATCNSATRERYICQTERTVDRLKCPYAPPPESPDSSTPAGVVALAVILPIVALALLAAAYVYRWHEYCCRPKDPEAVYKHATNLTARGSQDISAQIYGQEIKARMKFLKKIEPLERFPKATTTWDSWSDASSSLTWSSDDDWPSYRYSMFA